MKKEEISEILNNIDVKYIEEAEDYTGTRVSATETAAAANSHRFRFRWAFAAAALVLLIVAGSTFFAVRAEAMEYNKALEFFDSNGLSTEGLNRAEIKAVYRDITTKSFTYGKTAEVITKDIPGYAVEQESLSSETLAAIWEKNYEHPSVDEYGYSYQVEYKYAENGGYVTETTIICTHAGVEQWRSSFPDIQLVHSTTAKNGSLVYGTLTYFEGDRGYTKDYIAFLNNNGVKKWEYYLDHGLVSESLVAVLPGKGNNFDVFSSFFVSETQERHLCYIRLDKNGKEISFKDILQGPYSFINATRFGNGFLLHIAEWYSTEPGSTARLLRLDSKGTPLGEISYTADNCKYFITDMIEFGGKLILSAYAVPLKNDGSGQTCLSFDELDKYIEETYGYSRRSSEARSELDITGFIKRNFTAVLLLCDSESATPTLFYSVKEATVGSGSLFVNDSNELEWTVKSIEYVTHHSFSSQTLGIQANDCINLKYCFNNSGALLRIIDTGERSYLLQ